MTHPNNSRRGFTLIELLVAVLIIGILAAVAFPQYQHSVERSQAVEGMVKLKTLASALEVYYLQNGHYPAFGETLEVLDMQIQDTVQWSVYWNHGYLALVHTKPQYQLALVPPYGGTSVAGRISCDIIQLDELQNTTGARICKMLCNTSSLSTIWGNGAKGCVIQQ